MGVAVLDDPTVCHSKRTVESAWDGPLRVGNQTHRQIRPPHNHIHCKRTRSVGCDRLTGTG